jgi:hypothetical protein
MTIPANGYLRLPVKLFEVRDRATAIPVCAIRLMVRDAAYRHGVNPAHDSQFRVDDDAEEYLLRRAGYGDAIRNKFIAEYGLPPYIYLVRLGGGNSTYDPYDWGNRTMAYAHQHMIDHWDDLVSGQVIDVEFILGDTKEPKVSERLTEGR